MTSLTTITQKGQITIPIAMRTELGLEPYDRVQLKMENGAVKVEPVEDFLDLARKWRIKVPKSKSALKAREWMEKNYRRE